MIPEKETILSGAKAAFFEAMMDGYAGGDCKKSIKTKTPDGRTVIEFTTGDYKVIDDYRTTPHSNKSAGTTTILYKNDPVWWMSYGGWYKKEAIPFLKASLKKEYGRGVFFGGRGPGSCTRENLVYINFVENGSFSEFNGREEIVDRESFETMGSHKYYGMSLL